MKTISRLAAALIVCASSACSADVSVLDVGKAPGAAGEPSVLVAGDEHACALMADRTVRCWGGNEYGQLGNGGYGDSARPTTALIHGVAQVAAGLHNTCALMVDGTVRCWGDNAYCQLGTESSGRVSHRNGDSGFDVRVDASSTPLGVESVSNATQIAVGATQSCARIQDGTVRCWGRNVVYGFDPRRPQSQECARSVVTVPGLTNVRRVYASSRQWMCAVRDDGTAACWEGSYGALPSWDVGTLAPAQPVTELSSVADIVDLAVLTPNNVFSRDPAEAHRLTLCVLDARGVVHCRGNNFLGELGDGTAVSRDGFAPVRSLPPIVRLSANNRRVCAQSADGRLFCWGESYFRTPVEQSAALPERCVIRDDGSSLPCSTTPREVSAVRGVLDQTQGGFFTCVYQDDSHTRCMGFNVFGQLGDGTREFREAFTAVVY